MSVTALVQRKDVREALDSIIPPYQRSQRMPVIQVPCRAANPRLVGTAFDYALRFEIQRRAPRASAGAWVAEGSLRYLEGKLRRAETMRAVEGSPRMQSADGEAASQPGLRRLTRRVQRRIEKARDFLRKHLARRAPGSAWMERLAEHALRVARLDPIYRAGYLGPELLDPNTPEQRAEIVALLGCTPFGAILDGSDVVLNPTFGRWSSLVGGADADLFVGGRLIDLKVVANPAVERSMVRQLVAYLILAERARLDGALIPPVESLELYFARHAHLWTLPAAPILAHPDYRAVERRFLEIAQQIHRRPGFGSDEAPLVHAP